MRFAYSRSVRAAILLALCSLGCARGSALGGAACHFNDDCASGFCAGTVCVSSCRDSTSCAPTWSCENGQCTTGDCPFGWTPSNPGPYNTGSSCSFPPSQMQAQIGDGAQQYSGRTGVPLSFTSFATSPNGGIVAWWWTFDDSAEGVTLRADEQNPTVTFPRPGFYSVRLTVLDETLASASATSTSATICSALGDPCSANGPCCTGVCASGPTGSTCRPG